ncbi:hypothetical protein [Bacillus toyonensis]|uniref:hypothetical protein n=1 Tax=Bacillus toyonensis TaxID=155322 RepID=UPI002175D1CA|nr:hypothetical protein [Bacillus toyonensis]
MSNLTEVMEEQEVRELQRVVIKEELVALTGKHFDAALLNNLIFWAGITEKMDNNLKLQINQMEARKTKQSVVDKKKKKIRNGWFYKTGDELLFEIMNWGSASTISRAINNFVKQGWVEKGNNPDPTKKWDRTTWYKMNLTKIASDLHELGYALEGYTLAQKTEEKTSKIDQKHEETASSCILQNEICILHSEKSILHSDETIPESILQKVTSEKEFEEEEIITNPVTESMILDLMNQKIKEREITNPKTIKAIHDVSSKCKAIGTTDLVAAENYVIKVVEEKMSKFGQKQKIRQGKAKVSSTKYVRTEMTPEWVKEEDTSSTVEGNGQATEEDRKRLEEVLKKYKRD